ncbi:MAG: hypothetical protein M3525_07980 [Acidobacteriota bacterium]|nr:hypothetical protein [Acidobacteriota bacterium]
MNKLRIKKLGILSAAKMYALIMLVVSLLFSTPFGLFMMFSSVAMVENRNAGIGTINGGGVVAGLLFMIGVPIFYGAVGFVFGSIGALIYNIFAGIVGGVEIEVENIN